MQHPAYEQMVQFASQGELEQELVLAREQYVSRTGDMLASDPSYERRIASFLEWYVLDRPVCRNAWLSIDPGRRAQSAKA